MNELPELPNGWEWTGGGHSTSYYTTNFATKYQMGGPLAGEHGMGGYFGQVFWDKDGEHHVVIEPITGFNGDDPVYGYPLVTRSFETEEEAHNAVPELIKKL